MTMNNEIKPGELIKCKVKNLMALSLQMFPFSLLVGEVDEKGAVVDAEHPGPLPHG
jgi:hypothetical protein